jgi:hypothetical protein
MVKKILRKPPKYYTPGCYIWSLEMAPQGGVLYLWGVVIFGGCYIFVGFYLNVSPQHVEFWISSVLT